MSGDPVRVLIVEDNDDDAALICLELARGGFAVESRCVDTAAALTEALREPWDIVLSDFEMPTFNGLAAFDLVRSTDVELPFIFISGALGEDRAVAAMRAGARDYLLKGQLHRLSVAVRRELRASIERRARLQADAATARNQRRLELAAEASGVGVFEQVDQQAFFSDRCGEILGVDPRTETTPFPEWFINRLHPDDVLPFTAAQNALASHQTDRLQGEYRLRGPDGAWVFVDLELKQFQRNHAVGVITDLTARHRLEAELRHAQKMDAVGRVAGSVAHDFNNLLTAILGFGELLSADEQLSTAGADDLAEVLKAARKAADLTQQLLAFSRRRSIAPRVIDLNGIISDAARMLRRLLHATVQLDVVLGDAPWTIRIDPGAFEQVLVNLVVNARDAMPDGGHLVIETKNTELDVTAAQALSTQMTPGPFVQLSVSDTGSGMDAETMRHIFEPFFTTKEPGKGTGLGLSTCYGIVKQAGGTIHVDSKIGGGSRFELYFPRVCEAAETPSGPVTARSAPGADRVVLVVEDDQQIARLIGKVLSAAGYRVLRAGDAAAALEIERTSGAPIQLLLTDVILPGADGVELATEFGARRPDVPVAFMTGYSRYAALQGEAHVLTKPFTPDELVDHVRRAIAAGPRTVSQRPFGARLKDRA